MRKCFLMVLFFYASLGWGAMWSPNTSVSEEFFHSEIKPLMGLDMRGNAIAVWSDWDKGIYSARYDKEKKVWSEARIIGEKESKNLRLATSKMGQAILVWTRHVEGKEKLFFNAYHHQWGRERAVNEASRAAETHPSVALDEQGSGVIVWQSNLKESEDRSLGSVIQSATYQFKTNTISPIANISGIYTEQDQVGQPEVAINAQGFAAAVWRYDDQGKTARRYRIQSNTYHSGYWDYEEDVASSPISQFVLPQVFVGPKDEMMAVWLQSSLNYYIVTGALKEASWGNMMGLSDLGYVMDPIRSDLSSDFISGVFDKEGNGIVAWTFIDESLEIPQKRIQARVFQNSSWGPVSTLSDSAFFSDSPKLASDGTGVTWAIFSSEGFSMEMEEKSRFIYGSRYIVEGNGWCVPEIISRGLENECPNLCANEEGDFLVVWKGDCLLRSSYWKRDSAVVPLPPNFVKGIQKINEFATHSEILNILQWHPSGGEIAPLSYRIYRNKELSDLIGDIPANGKLIFKDGNRHKGKSYTYYIVSVSQDFKISKPVKITIAPNR